MVTIMKKHFLLLCCFALVPLITISQTNFDPLHVVVLGSSTAEGTGPSNRNNAWVNRYRAYLQSINPKHAVTNLARGGYTTYHIMPDGNVPPSGRAVPDRERNLTKALSLKPSAIIINLPSNDATNNYTVREQLANYEAVLAKARAATVPVWIATTQPRNLSDAQRQNLMAMRDSTMARWGSKAIDFWTDIAEANGRIKTTYDSGDGIHLNDAAHGVLFERVVAAEVHKVAALTDSVFLDLVQRVSFDFFWLEANASNGLIKDRSAGGAPCSIASVGFGLTAITIAIDHGWITREAGRTRVLNTLNTFWTKPQGRETAGRIGYKGFFYHFLDMNTALRTWNSELSSIDTALLLAGILDMKQYFTDNETSENDIRALADSIYYRVDWNWMRNFQPNLTLGWSPEAGFINAWWSGYNEAMIMVLLGLGSPTHPIPASTWNAWTSGYQWQTYYGNTYVIFPPLFGHQYSHAGSTSETYKMLTCAAEASIILKTRVAPRSPRARIALPIHAATEAMVKTCGVSLLAMARTVTLRVALLPRKMMTALSRRPRPRVRCPSRRKNLLRRCATCTIPIARSFGRSTAFVMRSI